MPQSFAPSTSAIDHHQFTARSRDSASVQVAARPCAAHCSGPEPTPRTRRHWSQSARTAPSWRRSPRCQILPVSSSCTLAPSVPSIRSRSRTTARLQDDKKQLSPETSFLKCGVDMCAFLAYSTRGEAHNRAYSTPVLCVPLPPFLKLKKNER